MKRRPIFYLLLITAFVIGVSIWMSWRHQIHQVASDKAHRERAQRLIATNSAAWDKEAFVAIKSDDFDATLTQAIRRRQMPGLTEDQIVKLIQSTESCFKTYNTPSFESYLKFKTSGHLYKFNFGGLIGQIIDGQAKNGSALPSDPGEKAKYVWEEMLVPPDSGERPYIDAVDIPRLNVRTSATHKPESEIVRATQSALHNLTKTVPNTLVEFDQSPDSIVKEKGALRFVVITSICRLSTTKNPSPISISFYWSPNENVWTPWEMACDASSRFYTVF